MVQGLIAGQKHLDPIVLRCPEQLAIIQAGPTHVGSGDNLVPTQQGPQGVVEIFVEQHLHGLVCARWAWANSIRRSIWETDKEGKPSRSSSIVSPRS